MNRIIILGCGYLGTNIANYIAKTYNTDIYLFGYENEYVQYLNPKVKFKEIAIQNIGIEHKEIFEKSIVIDATGNINATNNSEETGIAFLRNSELKVNLIQILSKLNINKYVFLSSGGTVYGDSKYAHREDEKMEPLNIYALEKIIIENYLKVNYLESNNCKYIIIRISNPYGGIISKEKKQGIIDVTISNIEKNKKLEFFGNLENIRDYIFINDVSEGIYKLAVSEIENDIFNLGTGKGYSIKEVFNLIEEVYKKKIIIEHKNIKTINIKSNILDIEKIEKEIGFTPKILVEDGIKKIINGEII